MDVLGTRDGAQEEHTWYEIRVKGHLDDRWAASFTGLTLTREADGETLLAGPVADQAALHGMLRTVRDLGLPLISVARIRSQAYSEETKR